MLARLGRIPEPRHPKQCRHRLTVLLLYGLLMFVFQFASQCEVNRELTRPQFEANLRRLFPELETLPHADTLFRRLLVYVLEASLAFNNGLVIPLLSEFLEYAMGDTKADKQDGERRAFARLSARLKALFPRLPILLLLDGLDANGPVMQRCRQYHWQFMIVLKDKDLPTVWEEFHGLHAVQPDGCQRDWGTRHQRCAWVNAIDYAFSDHGRRHLSMHVVVCEETWETIDA